MKPFFKSLFFPLTVSVAFSASAQKSHFKTNPEKAFPGERVSISYDPKQTPLEKSNKVSAIVYQYIDYRWKSSRLELKKDGDNWKTDFIPDAQSRLAALKFITPDTSDNNDDKGYFIMLFDKENKKINLPGSFAAWGLLRYPSFGYGVPNYFKHFSITDTAFNFNLQQELRYHSQESGVPLALIMAKWLIIDKGEVARDRIQKIVSFLEKEGGEDALWKAWKIESAVLLNRKRADSLSMAIINIYPAGKMRKLLDYRAVLAESNQNKKNQLAEKFLSVYPEKTSDFYFDSENFIKYSSIFLTAVLTSPDVYAALEAHINQLPYAATIDLYYKLIQIPHTRKDITDAKLYEYSLKMIKRLEYFRVNMPDELWYMAPFEWEQKFANDFAVIPLINHVNIAKNTGHVDEALFYASQAEKTLNFSRANLNDDFASMLNTTKQFKRLHEVLEKSIFQNQSSEGMQVLLKEDYQRNHKSLKGFDDYSNRLKNEDLLDKEKNALASTELNKPMPDFGMSDLTGKKTTLASLKGKTVVLDFWATWCVPCKAAFPGMKIAVDHYKNDPDVIFYFVDTEEARQGYQKEVAKFIKENNYPFNILFDNKVSGSKQNDEVFKRICEDFKISGIPLKLIIDATGRLRFISSGYNGSPSGLADEIITMVELSKKVK